MNIDEAKLKMIEVYADWSRIMTDAYPWFFLCGKDESPGRCKSKILSEPGIITWARCPSQLTETAFPYSS